MTRPTTIRRVLAIGALALLPLTGVACSSSGGGSSSGTTATQAYCGAWSDLVTAFGNYTQIDVINGGLDSVRTYVDQIQSAATELGAAADAALQPKVDAFSTSMKELVTTLTDPSLPVDRTQQVRTAKSNVDSAWNDLVSTLKTDCPGVKASSV